MKLALALILLAFSSGYLVGRSAERQYMTEALHYELPSVP